MKAIQGVHDGEHKEKQQTNKQQQRTRTNLESNTKRRNKLQDRGTIREAPTHRQSNKVFWHRACK